MPFRLLYFFSDGVCFIVYRIIGYRKQVVRSNLKLALPHRSDSERKAIEKKFYSHLCDMFLEMIKTLSISREEIDKRFIYTNLEVFKNLEKKGKSIAFMIPHYASYEWVVSINYKMSFEGYAIYKKIANPHFDALVKRIRSNFKAHLITTKETIPTIEENYKSGKLSVYGFASDQSPRGNKAYHWGSFMGVEVPVHTGAEMLAKRFDMNIIYLKVKRMKRGYYQGTFEVLSDDVTSIPDYQITDEFTRRVEKQILEAPEFYLWTHKRWKHSRSS
jgi:Kdo2-lipid IVA lauroyltransferase/acyltransferase